MQRTIFNTPIVTPLLRGMSRIICKLKGVSFVGEAPTEKKYVLISGPHTSNWDALMQIATCLHYRMPMYWLVKDSWTTGLHGPLLRFLGAIGVNRKQASGLVHKIADRMQQAEAMVIAIPPEGTRSKGKYWKTGFFHIAKVAGVGILPAYGDYRTGIITLAPLFMPGDNVGEHLPLLRTLYLPEMGKYPDLATEPDFSPKDLARGSGRNGKEAA